MKNNIKYITTILFVVVIFISQSCIEKFTPNLDGFEPSQLIVVEGQITDAEEPFRVKISEAFEIDNQQLYAPPVYGADVQIFDDRGNQFHLFYTDEGWYETEDKNLKGVVGSTYSLNITLEDGTHYESTPVLMQDVPEIDSVYFEETAKTRFEDGEAINENWLDIMVDSKDPTGQTKYWKWDFEETWEVRTPKDSVRIDIISFVAPSYTITVNLEFEKGNVKRGWDNKKERCWVVEHSASILIESSSKKSINEVARFPVKSIGPDKDRLDIKYSILVKQTALSDEMYNFWKRLKEANEEIGSMFDKTPSQIFGNIQCCDGKGKALGYFSASEVKTKRIFINPSEHNVKTKNAYEGCGYYYPGPGYYFGTITAVSNPKHESFIGMEYSFASEWCVDCRLYGTSVKPDFWED